MNEFIGHSDVVDILTKQPLPRVGLLVGPASIGKWTLTHRLAEHHGVAMVDRFLAPDGLTVETARTIARFVGTAPFGTVKLVTARLDGSTREAFNALLKVIEEPPDTARFLFTAVSASSIPATVVSRCAIFRVGLLSETEVRQILLDQGMRAAAAHRVSALGLGQVKAAQKIDTSDAARMTVLNIVKALAMSDAELFNKAFISFDAASFGLLRQWFCEALSSRWRYFTEADTFGLRGDRARLANMYFSFEQLAGANPRLGVRAALEPFLHAP